MCKHRIGKDRVRFGTLVAQGLANINMKCVKCGARFTTTGWTSRIGARRAKLVPYNGVISSAGASP